MYVEDITLAKEALERATSLIDARMNMIEKVDSHPLSWPVATEFQKMKRAKTDDEDDKLFAAAEKKVKEERKAKNDEAKIKAQAAGRQRINFAHRPLQPQGRFGKVCGETRFDVIIQNYLPRFCFVGSESAFTMLNSVILSHWKLRFPRIGNTEFPRVRESHLVTGS